MKKYVLLALVAGLSFMGLSANAQYAKGDLLLNGGLSLGMYGYNYYGSYTGFPALTANLEYSLNDKWSVGGYMGYFARTYSDRGLSGNGSFKDYDHRLSVFGFGARGTFHATSSLNEWFNWSINEDKLDLYASAILGYNVYTWKYGYDDGYSYPKQKAGGLRLGPVVGIRYFFNDKVGAYFESGFGGFGVATLGVSFKL